MKNMYNETVEDVTESFDTSLENGLSSSQVDELQEKYGPNELEEGDNVTAGELFLKNLNNLVVYLLGAAALLSLFMGDYIEMLAILLAVAIAVFTGFFVELRAQKSVESLQEIIYTTARVLREGEVQEVESSELVPGDILLLEEGDAVAADGRLFEDKNLAIIESALTGESAPVEKDADASFEEEDPATGDQINMVFSGTAVTRGNGRAIVTGTGMDTEVGKISEMLQGESDTETPLDKEIDKLAKLLIVVAFSAAALVFVIGLITGMEWTDLLHVAIILAVAAIPEAMPAVETITLSRGMQIMADHKALVKNLSSVETLGSTTVIASDKTGTMTENQMMVQEIIMSDGEEFQVDGEGYHPSGDIRPKDSEESLDLPDPDTIDKNDFEGEDNALFQMILSGLLGSNARLVVDKGEDEEELDPNELEEDYEPDDENAQYDIMGDPTDGALVVLARKIGLDRQILKEADWKKKDEIPFDSEHKYMATLFDGSIPQLVVKGAIDVLTDMAYQENDDQVTYWQEKNEELAGHGMRVIAIGSIPLESDETDREIEELMEEKISELNFQGLFGIIDPPREDVKKSVDLTQNAGIHIKMITGDHPRTASVIAEEIGIEAAENTMTGKEIDEAVNQDGFLEKVKETGVFARVSPENKLQIVEALRDDSQVVAMTGDGVNDAPALNGSDIGVAMGIRGTEVAKDSSDMILTDDRFGTIVKAVEVGRIIFDNMKKYISFLFTCNMVEIMTILLTLIFTLPMPIAPLHILFLNLIIDIAPAMSLAFEPEEEDVMQRPPRRPDGGLMNKQFLSRIIISGIVIGIASFIMFTIFFTGDNIEYAQTATFTFMAIAQLMHIFNVRKLNSFGLDKTIFDNKWLVGALALSLLLQLAAVYLPFMNTLLGTVPLSPMTWLYIFIGAAIATIIVFLIKRIAIHD